MDWSEMKYQVKKWIERKTGIWFKSTKKEMELDIANCLVTLATRNTDLQIYMRAYVGVEDGPRRLSSVIDALRTANRTVNNPIIGRCVIELSDLSKYFVGKLQ